MVLKVDLQCHRCYKKIKKLLCKFIEIRDQKYDEKANTVTITVVSSNPEKIRDKLRCKGGALITSIEIVKPKDEDPPPKPPVPDPPSKPSVPGYPLLGTIGVCLVPAPKCHDSCDDCGSSCKKPKPAPKCHDSCDDCGCSDRKPARPCNNGCSGGQFCENRCDQYFICQEKKTQGCAFM